MQGVKESDSLLPALSPPALTPGVIGKKLTGIIFSPCNVQKNLYPLTKLFPEHKEEK